MAGSSHGTTGARYLCHLLQCYRAKMKRAKRPRLAIRLSLVGQAVLVLTFGGCIC
ncbi:MAG: hypothetical protein H6668_20850 [Ardenticatenaceae bacterium]|nr:hypothetical protein [Ardenticatenaceae bacterium]